MSNSNELINILSAERRKQDISTYRLAKKIHIAHTTIGRIEKREINPTLDIFIKLAEELGYDLTLVKREQPTTLKQDAPKVLKRTISTNLKDK